VTALGLGKRIRKSFLDEMRHVFTRPRTCLSTAKPPAPTRWSRGTEGETETNSTTACESTDLEIVSATPTRSVIERVAECIETLDGLTVKYDPDPTEPRSGVFVSGDSLPVCDELRSWLDTTLPDGLYTHQHSAISQILRGRNVAITTGTSSGKTIAFLVPTVEKLLNDPDATVLFLYPTKALANDQLIKVRSAVDEINGLRRIAAARPYLASRYDGSVSSNMRKLIRAQVGILLTNPDMLHVGILPNHARLWARFFEHLRYVVIDEAHSYSGVFGAHVGYVIRRLRQVCKHHGSNPVMIAASATMSDPQLHMERLTGLPFSVISSSENGGSQGRMKLWMITGKGGCCDTARRISLRMADRGMSVLVFCQSRLTAEKLLSKIRANNPDAMSYVHVYRAGLSSRQREFVEAGLRNKDIRLVFATSALELGVDIGAIDVVVCAGLPCTAMSLWQRIGRTARSGRDGAIVLVPGDCPIDGHYSDHPADYLALPNESLTVPLSNHHVAVDHYACAAREIGGVQKLDVDILGQPIERIRSESAKSHEAMLTRTYPHSAVDIRSTGETRYSLDLDGEVIGEIGQMHLVREAYKHAVYLHGGEPYRVVEISRNRRTVRLETDISHHETQSCLEKDVVVTLKHHTADYGDLVVSTADLIVTERVCLIFEKDRAGTVLRTWKDLSTPSYRLPTTGIQFLIREPVWSKATSGIESVDDLALRAFERLVSSLFPVVTQPCEPRDYSSHSERYAGSGAVIYLYDCAHGWVDLTAQVMGKERALVERALDRIRTCGCHGDQGCFKCVANPSFSEPASKRDTERLISAILDILSRRQPVLTFERKDGSNFQMREGGACETCGAALTGSDSYCSNCGTRLQ